jgi:hypothetical protein
MWQEILHFLRKKALGMPEAQSSEVNLTVEIKRTHGRRSSHFGDLALRKVWMLSISERPKPRVLK